MVAATPGPYPNDRDGDGLAEWAELRSRTNPLDASDFLKAEGAAMFPGGTLRLDWLTRGGVSYQPERGMLGSTNWIALPPVISSPTDISTNVLIPHATTNGPLQFFRIRVAE
jgi:hypothetical protein